MRRGMLIRMHLDRVVLGVAVVLFLFAPGELLAGVAGTKHNFGAFGPGDVYTFDTSEICVFCHTPHHASPEGALWNRDLSAATYDIYQSLTMVALAGQPTGSSKLCLSCHDGTMAIGSVLNLPGKLGGTAIGTIGGIMTMEATPSIDPNTGVLLPVSAAYIGTDLSDDHPISFLYVLSYPSNTEIKDPATLPPEIRLDNSGQVQCASCHDPHGSAWPKFMVASIENGTLCLACHDKRYWATMPAVHSTSDFTWNEVGENPWDTDMGVAGFTDDTPALHSCLGCHSSHGGAPGKSLLKGVNPLTQTVDDEEWTCFKCHNGNLVSPDLLEVTKDMEGAFDKLYKHDVKGTFGAHIPSREVAGDPVRETAANLGFNRHAECADCHNPHGTMDGNHVIGGVNGNIIGANHLGSWGVKPFPWATAGSPTLTYQVVDFTTTLPGGNNLEGYLCLKCHSYYAYGLTPPDVPSGNADGSIVRQSDISTDFNPDNMGFHPVFGQGKNRPPIGANLNWPLNSLGLTNTFTYVDFPGIGLRDSFYNVMHNSTITCSDCHGSNDYKGFIGPPGLEKKRIAGPHASDYKWILRSNESGVGIPAGTEQNHCYNCHRRDVYGDEGYVGPEANFSRVTHPVDGLGLASPFYTVGIDTGNVSNRFGILCLSCHGGAYDPVNNVMNGIHGSNAAAGASGDPLGYRMMNGACVESYTRPLNTGATGTINFRSVDPLTDPVCNKVFGPVTTVPANYSCNTIADCSN